MLVFEVKPCICKKRPHCYTLMEDERLGAEGNSLLAFVNRAQHELFSDTTGFNTSKQHINTGGRFSGLFFSSVCGETSSL